MDSSWQNVISRLSDALYGWEHTLSDFSTRLGSLSSRVGSLEVLCSVLVVLQVVTIILVFRNRRNGK